MRVGFRIARPLPFFSFCLPGAGREPFAAAYQLKQGQCSGSRALARKKIEEKRGLGSGLRRNDRLFYKDWMPVCAGMAVFLFVFPAKAWIPLQGVRFGARF
jgi:hypothetical protein